jgi:hypothetical protein
MRFVRLTSIWHVQIRILDSCLAEMGSWVAEELKVFTSVNVASCVRM